MYESNDKFNRFAITGELANDDTDLSSKRTFGVGCVALLESFSERTTSHGLPHMYHARGWCRFLLYLSMYTSFMRPNFEGVTESEWVKTRTNRKCNTYP